MIKWDDILAYAKGQNPKPERRVEKTVAEWKHILPEEVFRVTRQHGTERAFSSDMCTRFEPGRYRCACCDTLLFDADQKFDSGTGWPSFAAPAAPAAISYKMDQSHGMIRVEALCNTCDAHLGHVFPDGPKPTGLRYCMNAVSLKKE